MDLPPPIVIALDDPLAGYHPWTSYVTPAAKWGAMPVTIAFAGEPPLPGDVRALLDVAARAWSQPSCSGAAFVVGETRATFAEMNGLNDVVVHRTDWPAPLAAGAAGHTVIYTLGEKIVEADIHLNLRDFSFVVGAAPPKVDLQALLAHELGHVLGIGHTDVARATMNAGLPSGIAARSLERDDVDAVCAMYPGSGVPCGGCPSGFSCVGFTCERPDEPAVNGAPCAPATEVRRCDGAGDVARCVQTSLGERCARPCPPECGAGLRCATIGVDDTVCVPLAAEVDAGAVADGAPDSDTTAPPPPADAGCQCTHRRPRDAAFAWPFGALMVVAAKRRSRRR